MNRDAASADMAYIRDVMRRTQARIDTHSFHSVHWGAIVLVWYPLANWFCSHERYDVSLALTIGCAVAGGLFSAVREIRLRGRPRLDGVNTFIADQVKLITAFCIGAGLFFTFVGPPLGILDRAATAVVWGLTYAVLAFMLGVVYTREYLYAGVAILAGSVLALIQPQHMGYILGPFMGLGLMIPGLMGERRVKRLAAGHD
ncbi:hypothetical protein H8E07_05035 [bacterium]|nr:hypothetical protein [bacterium]